MNDPELRTAAVATALSRRGRAAAPRQSGAAAALFALALAILFFVPRAFAVEVLEEIIDQRYELDSDATLSISNTDGSIRIYGGDKQEVLLQAIKKAYTPERLKGIVVDVKATRNSIAISDRSGTVDYIMIVPQTVKIAQLDLVNGEVLVEGLRGGSATAHLVNGWLGGHNCFADLTLTVETGRLDVAYDWWESRKFSVKASSTHGSVRAILPSDSSVILNATAPEGRIANTFDTQKDAATGVVHSVNTVIGSDAEAVIELQATRGNIRIDKSY